MPFSSASAPDPEDPPTGSGWTGWLAGATLSVPEPDEALTYWSGLLSGDLVNDAVVLGSGTSLRATAGEPGLATAQLELAGAPTANTASSADISRDPDGREFALTMIDRVAERKRSTDPSLGHLTFMSPDPVGVQHHYEGLGFTLTEGLRENFRWLRCNPVHHTVAFSRSQEPMLHHVGIEFSDRSAMIDACDRLAEQGLSIEYGPGRHMVGNNIFIYFRDRHGIRFEFFCELERIADEDHEPIVHEGVPREQSINIWGPQPPETFFTGT